MNGQQNTPNAKGLDSFLSKIPTSPIETILLSRNIPTGGPNGKSKQNDVVHEQALRKRLSEPCFQVTKLDYARIYLSGSAETDEEESITETPSFSMREGSVMLKKNMACHVALLESYNDEEVNGIEGCIMDSAYASKSLPLKVQLWSQENEQERKTLLASSAENSLGRSSEPEALIETSSLCASLDLDVEEAPVSSDGIVEAELLLLPTCIFQESHNWLNDLKRVAKIVQLIKPWDISKSGLVCIIKTHGSGTGISSLVSSNSLRASPKYRMELRKNYLFFYKASQVNSDLVFDSVPCAFLNLKTAHVDMAFGFKTNNVLKINVGCRENENVYIKTTTPEECKEWASMIREATEISPDAFLPGFSKNPSSKIAGNRTRSISNSSKDGPVCSDGGNLQRSMTFNAYWRKIVQPSAAK
jgi:hypothetical protein